MCALPSLPPRGGWNGLNESERVRGADVETELEKTMGLEERTFFWEGSQWQVLRKR